MNQFDLILQSLDAMIKGQVWLDKKPSEILRILLHVHSKGWLYTPHKDGEITAVICAYRIKEVTDENLTKIPKEDSGNILYVPFVFSLKIESNLFSIIRETCKIYLEQNPDIEEIVLEDKNKQVKKYKLNKTLQGV